MTDPFADVSARPPGRFPARRAAAAALALGPLLVLPLSAPAQDAAGQDGYTITERAEPPRSETGRAYLSGPGARMRAEPVYADGLEGDLAGPERKPPPKAERREPLLSVSPNVGALIGVGIVALILVLLLKFAGGGALLAREPAQGRRAAREAAAPDAWAAEAADLSEAEALLARLSAMADRGAALAILLRHALIAAAGAMDLRFARADTEREALAKIPADWPARPPLEALLRAAELAHYGGRKVDDAGFGAALEAGRSVLAQAEGRR
ncbi:hypothetical protein ACQ5SO_13470 [Rhodovulum sp. DZ06]|uniref:hypothetical protein n=1 Tax=Rhodovulum sp. DZ06 TaxID=3425126 RepID=UPI003D342408